MKKLIIISAILIFGFTANAETSSKYYHSVGGYFYTNLTPHGTWIEIGNGIVAWRPTIMHRRWAPYTLGRWVWTDYGWYWDSYEAFGHIVFHYGRWFYDDFYGWIWIPDYDWAPAWVEWRYDDDYIGWAPLHPYAVFSINFGIRITYEYYVPYTHWHFVTYKHFYNPKVYNYYVPEKHKYRIYGRTKYRNDYRYYNGRIRNEGVDFDLVRKRSGQKIEKRDLITSNDSREFENIKRRNDERIRTFIADRNEIERDREALRDVKFERNDRRPNLEIEKVELAEVKRNRTNDRNEIRERQDSGRDRNIQLEDNKRMKNDSERKEIKRNEEMREVEEQKRISEQERSRTNDSKNLEKRKESNIDKRVNQQRNEVKRNEQVDKRNFEQKRNETNIRQMDRNTNERKVETNRNQTSQRNNNTERNKENRSEHTR
ncbi:DUF6600 domain-containing protein [Ignavibacterium sp.]|uniref:DUF6600 domain-containing protein n=1 Tax=Ignavibacterium sp. TaxID=2651167 RepID=UPI00307E758F